MIPVHSETSINDLSACAVDGFCSDTGCGCPPGATASTAATPAKRGLATGLVAVACAAACLAVPLAVGSVAAVSGAIAGQWWLVGVVVAVAVTATVVLSRRRGGRAC